MRFLVLLVFVLTLYQKDIYSQSSDSLDVNTISFEMKNLKDQVIRIPDPDQRIVVINFWSVFCRVCVKEIPELNKLIYSFSTDDVAFIALSADTREEIQVFLAKQEFLFSPCYINRRTFIDLSKKISGNIALPFTAVIGRDGTIIYHQGFVGEMDLDKIKAAIETAL